MNDTQETIADIINEIRRDTTPYSTKVAVELEEQTTGNRALLQDAATCLRDDEHYVKELADRLEAAMEREHHFADGSKMGGNVAAMYEALDNIAHYDENDYGMDDPYCADGHICADIARKALSKPPRNCDVGTPEEQGERFFEFCKNQNCEECPYRAISGCEFAWAQMPYERNVTL